MMKSEFRIKAGVNNEVDFRPRFISSVLSPIWLLRSSWLHVKVGLDSASKRYIL